MIAERLNQCALLIGADTSTMIAERFGQPHLHNRRHLGLVNAPSTLSCTVTSELKVQSDVTFGLHFRAICPNVSSKECKSSQHREPAISSCKTCASRFDCKNRRSHYTLAPAAKLNASVVDDSTRSKRGAQTFQVQTFRARSSAPSTGTSLVGFAIAKALAASCPPIAAVSTKQGS